MNLIKLHAAAAALTVATYAILTGDDPGYIAAMMLLYIWMMVAIMCVKEWVNDRTRRHRRRASQGQDMQHMQMHLQF